MLFDASACLGSAQGALQMAAVHILLKLSSHSRGTDKYAQLARARLRSAYHVQVKRLIFFADSEDGVDNNVSQLVSQILIQLCP